jgi:hypothetical protein
MDSQRKFASDRAYGSLRICEEIVTVSIKSFVGLSFRNALSMCIILKKFERIDIFYCSFANSCRPDLTEHHATKAYWVSGSIAPLIL